MNDLLRSLTKNERPWANRSGCSPKMSEWVNRWFFWANRSFAYFFAKKRVIRSENRWANSQPWQRAMGVIFSGYNKGENCQPHTKNMNFLGESLIFCSRFTRIPRESLTLLVCKDWREWMQIAHSRSLKWAILSKGAKRKWAYSQPCFVVPVLHLRLWCGKKLHYIYPSSGIVKFKGVIAF